MVTGIIHFKFVDKNSSPASRYMTGEGTDIMWPGLLKLSSQHHLKVTHRLAPLAHVGKIPSILDEKKT